MDAGLSRIRDIFRFYSRIFCFAAEEFCCRMASEDRRLWLPGKRFSVFTGVGELARWGFSAPGQVPPAPVTDVSPEAGRERGDSIKNAGGDAPARYPAMVRTEERSGFSAVGYLCKYGIRPLPEEREMIRELPTIPLPERERYLEKRAVPFSVLHFRRPLRNPGVLLRFWRSGPYKARQGRTGRLFFSRFPCGPAGGRLPPWRGCVSSCPRRRGPAA